MPYRTLKDIDMNVSISKKELEAIYHLIDQMEGDLESASDPEYIDFANETIETASNFIEKCKKAKVSEAKRHSENKIIRAFMKEHPIATRGMSIAKIKKLLSK